MKNELVLFKAKDENVVLEVNVTEETVWLTQEQLCQLYERDQSVISRHISNIFKEGELEKESNMHFLHISNSDKPVAVYNLDVIISVGYRAKSQRGIEFRRRDDDKCNYELFKIRIHDKNFDYRVSRLLKSDSQEPLY